MTLHELSYGKIIILEENIAEVLINEGVEMDMIIADHFHNFLLSNLTPLFQSLSIKLTPTHMTLRFKKNWGL